MPESDGYRLFLLLGSNIHPERNLPAAVAELQRVARVVSVSRVWESAPVGFAQQANFLNAAVLVESPLSPSEFRNGPIAAIEQRLQRVRDSSNVNAPRTIDIDIVLCDAAVNDAKGRHLPDPAILTRAFVAVPLAELAPDRVHPDDGRTLAEIAAPLHDESPDLILRSDVSLPVDSSP